MIARRRLLTLLATLPFASIMLRWASPAAEPIPVIAFGPHGELYSIGVERWEDLA